MNSVIRALAAVIAFFSSPLGATTLEFSQIELQDRVAPQFPMQRSLLGVSVGFTEPVVFLSETENRMGVELTVTTALSETIKGKGRVMVDGTLAYKAETGQFVLREPHLRKLKIENIPDDYQERVRETIDWVARNTLVEIVVYQLADQDLREKMAKRFLKSMEVKKGKLVVELELF